MDISFDYAMLTRAHGKKELIPYGSFKWIQKALENGDIFVKVLKNHHTRYYVKTKKSIVELKTGDLLILFENELYVKQAMDIFDEFIHKKMIIGL